MEKNVHFFHWLIAYKLDRKFVYNYVWCGADKFAFINLFMAVLSVISFNGTMEYHPEGNPAANLSIALIGDWNGYVRNDFSLCLVQVVGTTSKLRAFVLIKTRKIDTINLVKAEMKVWDKDERWDQKKSTRRK